jgi:hypothetical protein
METLAQSVSTMAPTTTPVATIPLVCALVGNGTWLAYVLATAAILLVAVCIGRFARYSASPGSLYTYAAKILPPWLGATVAWSLLLAYVATGSRWRDYLNDPSVAHAAIVKLNPVLNSEWMQFSWQALRDGCFVTGERANGGQLGNMESARWTQMYEQLLALKVIAQPFDPATAYTLQFAPSK